MDDTYLEVFKKVGLDFARLLGSKTLYRHHFPSHFVVFNCRIYTEIYYLSNASKIKDFFKGQEGEIWYGDLDFSTEDLNKLRSISLEIGPIVITTEHGARILVFGGT